MASSGGTFENDDSAGTGNANLHYTAYGVSITNSAVIDATTPTVDYGIYDAVNGSAATSYGAYISDGGSSTTNYGLYLTGLSASTDYSLYSASTAPSYFAGKVGIGNLTPAAALDVTGSINYSGLLTDTSDRRVKENIHPLDARQLDLITKLEPVSYNKIGSPDREFGFIAQDVDPVYPDLVGIRPDGIRTMNYMGLISPMVEAIKEQQREIADLKIAVLLLGLCGLVAHTLLPYARRRLSGKESSRP